MAWFENVGETIQENDPHMLIVKVRIPTTSCLSVDYISEISQYIQPEHARQTIRMIEIIYQSSKEERVVTVSG